MKMMEEFMCLGDSVMMFEGCVAGVGDREVIWVSYIFGLWRVTVWKELSYKAEGACLQELSNANNSTWEGCHCLRENEMVTLGTEIYMVRAICGVQLIDTNTWTHGHVLRREDGHVLRRAFDFEVEGQRKKGRLKRTCK